MTRCKHLACSISATMPLGTPTAVSMRESSYALHRHKFPRYLHYLLYWLPACVCFFLRSFEGACHITRRRACDCASGQQASAKHG